MEVWEAEFASVVSSVLFVSSDGAFRTWGCVKDFVIEVIFVQVAYNV